MKTFVKICGITNVEDAKAAANLGADFIGIIVEIEYSPRSVNIQKASNIIDGSSIPVILLMEKACSKIQNIACQLNPYGVQLVGECPFNDIEILKNTTGCAVWKTIHLSQQTSDHVYCNNLLSIIKKYHRSGVDAIVLDTMVEGKKGGTGRICDWAAAAGLVASSEVPVFLAGGITPENAKEAINTVNPYGIDLSSGVEKSPGRKDPEKISKLMQNIDKINQ